MIDWITQNIPKLLAEIILIILFPIGSMIYTRIKKIDKEYIIPIVFMCFVIGVFMSRSFDWKAPVLTPTKIENQLQKLALKAKYSVRDDSKDYARFQFVIEKMNKEKIPVEAITFINKKEEGQSDILMIINLTISDENQKLLDNMGQIKRLKFTSNLKIELLRHGVDYEGLKYPFSKITLIDRFVYDESLTLLKFLNKLKPIRWAKLLVDVLISTKVKELSQSQMDQEATNS